MLIIFTKCKFCNLLNDYVSKIYNLISKTHAFFIDLTSNTILSRKFVAIIAAI
ncbi:hypothetical protein ACVWYG_001043 [Pedobacter sp. UYEF25]